MHRAVASTPGWVGSAVRSIRFMLDPLTLLPLPTLPGERVILREPRDSDVDDRLRHPIDPEEEDNYGSSWRREWDGRRYHTREHLTATRCPPDPGTYTWGSNTTATASAAPGFAWTPISTVRPTPWACSSPPCAAGGWAVWTAAFAASTGSACLVARLH